MNALWSRPRGHVIRFVNNSHDKTPRGADLDNIALWILRRSSQEAGSKIGVGLTQVVPSRLRVLDPSLRT